METSAKSGFNVDKLFSEVGKILYNVSMENSDVNKVRKIYNNCYNIII
jgi:hypothetical protein